MKSYYRLMLGAGSIHANDCFNEEVVGTDYGLNEDLTARLPDQWRDFNKEFIPIFIEIFLFLLHGFRLLNPSIMIYICINGMDI